MNSSLPAQARTPILVFAPFLFLSLCLFSCGCRPETPRRAGVLSSEESPVSDSPIANPCDVILAAHSGDQAVDQEIRRLQQKVQSAPNPALFVERLGWTYVSKARTSFDPGFYKLAEQCAFCLESSSTNNPDAWLLHGHVLQNLHRFHEAEPLAISLVANRGLPADFGLLGDVLMELGKLDPAIEAYQKMMNLKPDLHAYARTAHVRWLTGDLEGALEAMKLAARAATPHDPESAAWVNSRLAWYEFQAGAFDNAREACASALDYQRDYPPALLLKGRLLLGEAQSRAAVESLRRACQLNPQPEYQWWFSEALHEAGQIEEARSIEAQLSKEGELNDPRTLCLFLATRSENVSSALRLAQNEMKTREDVFTLDALAWAEAAAGQWPEANAAMFQALSAGTRDARLFLHAGIIATKMADPERANLYLEKAAALMHTLLPSEQKQWEIAVAQMALSMAPASANPELSVSNQ